jgi:hypothetical protein
MHARVNTFQWRPGDVARAIEVVREEVIPSLRQTPGNAGIISLVDRRSGKAIGITLWESEGALRESEDAASRLRQKSVAAQGSEVVSVERYEITDFVLAGQPVVV